MLTYDTNKKKLKTQEWGKKLNDSGDQAADRQKLEQETIPESSTSRYGRKRTRVLRENYVPWNNIHVDTQ